MNEDKKEKLKEYLNCIDKIISNGKYKDNWDSLANHPVPTWYKNAKFGIFITWGVYAVPAFGNEWYPRLMYREGTKENLHHLSTFGSTKEYGYKKFVPQFKNENFNPAKWSKLFKESGAKFVLPVAEHCDGFQMYDSDLSDWNSVNKGPHKDMLGLLKKEVEKSGMVFCTSSHRAEHYWFMSAMREYESDFDPKEVEYSDMYWPSHIDPFPRHDGIYEIHQVSGFDVDTLFMEDWLARSCEIVDKYKPSIMYFDWWIQVEPMRPYIKKFAAYYYNRALEWDKPVTINYKNDSFMYSAGVRDFERGQLSELSPDFWQNDTSIAEKSWSYTKTNEYKSPVDIVCNLVDICSKNGSLLLNIDPKADGTIPHKTESILKEIGSWLKINGEGIYNTSYWKKYGEGPTKTMEGSFTDSLRSQFTSKDIRFTYKTGAIYAFVMKWPKSSIIHINSFGVNSKTCNSLIKNISILGYSKEIIYNRENEFLTVEAKNINSSYPVCIKISID